MSRPNRWLYCHDKIQNCKSMGLHIVMIKFRIVIGNLKEFWPVKPNGFGFLQEFFNNSAAVCSPEQLKNMSKHSFISYCSDWSLIFFNCSGHNLFKGAEVSGIPLISVRILITKAAGFAYFLTWKSQNF